MSGSASGPGSWPPANFTSASTRLSTDGWVSKILEKPVRGLSMHISITAELALAISPRPSILRSAEIMASGFFVSSTEPESARYSRCRDSAKRMTIDSTQATTINASAMTMAMPAPPFLSPSLLEEERRPPNDVWKNIRNTISPKNETTPAITSAITSMRTSPLRMWVSSWPSTASSSWSFNAFIRPRVTVIEYCFWLSPVAKALSASSSAMRSFGVGIPREMQRFSRRL